MIPLVSLALVRDTNCIRMSKARVRAYLLLLLVSIIWGVASPLVKYTLTWFSPLLFLTYRFFISTIVSLIIFGIKPVSLPKRADDKLLIFVTMMLSTPITLGLFFLGLSKTSALSGSLITAGAPILLVAAGALFLRERITKIETLGIIVTIMGTFLISIGPLLFNSTANHLGTSEGNMLMVLATIANLTATFFSKICVNRGITTRTLAHGQFILGFVLFLPLLFFFHSVQSVTTTILTAPWQAHAGVLFMALISGSLAYWMQDISLKYIEVSEAAIFTYLQTVWAAILAVLWLGEPITASYIIGGGVLVAGVALSEYHGRRRATKVHDQGPPSTQA